MSNFNGNKKLGNKWVICYLYLKKIGLYWKLFIVEYEIGYFYKFM